MIGTISLVDHMEQRIERHLGGASAGRLITLLAVTQALDSLDRGSLGAMAPTLEKSLRFSNTGLGMLLAVVTVTSAVATLGAGILIDRGRRTRLLAWSLTLWAVAMAAGHSPSRSSSC